MDGLFGLVGGAGRLVLGMNDKLDLCITSPSPSVVYLD